jgi:hypothetical protein
VVIQLNTGIFAKLQQTMLGLFYPISDHSIQRSFNMAAKPSQYDEKLQSQVDELKSQVKKLFAANDELHSYNEVLTSRLDTAAQVVGELKNSSSSARRPNASRRSFVATEWDVPRTCNVPSKDEHTHNNSGELRDCWIQHSSEKKAHKG